MRVKSFKPSTFMSLAWIAALLQIVWGLVPSASALVIEEIPVELYIAIRWTISSLLFSAYLAFRKKWRPFLLMDLIKVAFLGILAYAIGSLGYLYSLKIGGVTNFALMNSFSPIVSSLVALLILKERPRKLFYVALPVCVLGLYLLVSGKTEISNFKIAGFTAALLVISAALESLAFTFSKRLKETFGVIEYLAIAQIGAALFMWLLQFTFFHQTSELTKLTLRGFGAAIFVSVIACVFCYAIIYWLLKHMEGHKLALFDGVHTLSATAFGWILFHETINAKMIAGGVLLIAGLILGNGFTDSLEKEPENAR